MPAFFITLGIIHLGPVSPANPHLQIKQKIDTFNYYNILSIYLSQKQGFLYFFQSSGHKNIQKHLFQGEKKTKGKLISPIVVSYSLQLHGRPWNSLSQNTGVDSFSLLQGTFPTQGLNPGLPYYQWILYQLSHMGRPRIPTQESNWGLLHCREILYQLSYQGSLFIK